MNQIPLKPQNERFTDDQWQAIFDQGDNLLVSASAGSGKTTVLVRRVIEKLKMGFDIDELLIVTFTEAAAREMKERVVNLVGSDANYIQISTFHSLGLKIIKQNYELLGLSLIHI